MLVVIATVVLIVRVVRETCWVGVMFKFNHREQLLTFIPLFSALL